MRAAVSIFVGIPGPELDAQTSALLAQHQPGGIVLFGRNVKDPEQLRELVAALRRVLPDAVVAIDAEGGRVDRLKDVVGPAPSAAVLARNPPALSMQAGTWVAHALRLFDIDMTFAPVVDLNRGESDNALDGRYLGARPADVTARARAFLRGLQAGGAGGCLKHFPGLGGAAQDTHFKVAVVPLSEAALRADLDPFEVLMRLSGAVMASHAIYPVYDSEKRPATLSPPLLVGLLRERLRFDGVTFSDDLEMKALDEWGDLPLRAERCFAAGCDVLPVCQSQSLEALPEIAARLEAPALEGRRVEAHRRLELYRQRLRTLRTSREYLAMQKIGPEERLETVRRTLAQIGESGRQETA